MDIANNPHAYRSHCPMQIVRNVPSRLFAMSHADCSQCPIQIVRNVPCKMYMMARESQFKR